MDVEFSIHCHYSCDSRKRQTGE